MRDTGFLTKPLTSNVEENCFVIDKRSQYDPRSPALKTLKTLTRSTDLTGPPKQGLHLTQTGNPPTTRQRSLRHAHQSLQATKKVWLTLTEVILVG